MAPPVGRWPATTNRLGSSRLIKFGIIGITVLGCIYVANTVLLAWIARRIMDGAATPDVLDTIVGALSTSAIATGVTTITTAVVARYGLREATANLGGKNDHFTGTVAVESQNETRSSTL